MNKIETTLKPEECNCLAVRQAARAVTQLYDRHLAAVGLTATQFWLLAKLVHGGPASINEVARLMMSDRTTVGRTLGPLEREGLIELRVDPEDRRSRGWKPLSETDPGTPVQVASVFERDRKLLEFLNNIGIHPGATLQVTARNYDETLTLRIDDLPIVQLGRAAAAKVWVEAVEVASPV